MQMFHQPRQISFVQMFPLTLIKCNQHLDHRLKHTGFKLFDAQFITPHLSSLGAIKIKRHQYLYRLQTAIQQQADFLEPTYSVNPYDIVQRSGQTS